MGGMAQERSRRLEDRACHTWLHSKVRPPVHWSEVLWAAPGRRGVGRSHRNDVGAGHTGRKRRRLVLLRPALGSAVVPRLRRKENAWCWSVHREKRCSRDTHRHDMPADSGVGGKWGACMAPTVLRH